MLPQKIAVYNIQNNSNTLIRIASEDVLREHEMSQTFTWQFKQFFDIPHAI